MSTRKVILKSTDFTWSTVSSTGLHFFGERNVQDSHNLKCALDNPHVVQAKLDSELEAGRIAGSFQSSPHPDLKISPLGVVPKRQEGQFRIIHHRASGLSVK